MVRFLPTYGAVQAGMSAAFSDASAVQGLVIQCLWLIAAASAGFLVFRRRTGNALPPERRPWIPAPQGQAAAGDTPAPLPSAEPGPSAEHVRPT